MIDASSTWTHLVLSVTYGVIICIAISTFGFLIDKKVPPYWREKSYELVDWINTSSWPACFMAIFDTVFCPFSSGRPSISRSLFASAIATFVIAILWFVFQQPNLGDLFAESDRLLGISVFLISLSVTTNLLGDHFSYWETRLIIKRMAKSRSTKKHVMYILVDFIFSTLIFVLGLTLGAILFLAIGSVFIPDYSTETIGEAFSQMPDLLEIAIFSGGFVFLAEHEMANIFGIFYFTTLTTSMWIWIFRIGIALWWFLRLLTGFHVQNHPVGAIMTMGGALWGVVVVLALTIDKL